MTVCLSICSSISPRGDCAIGSGKGRRRSRSRHNLTRLEKSNSLARSTFKLVKLWAERGVNGSQWMSAQSSLAFIIQARPFTLFSAHDKHRLIRVLRMAGMEVNGEGDWKWVSFTFCGLLNGVELLYRARKYDLQNQAWPGSNKFHQPTWQEALLPGPVYTCIS